MEQETYQTMTHSPELTTIAAALVKVQTEIENPHKNSLNPHYKSTYADLTEIINTARPVLNENGIAVVQSPGMQNGNASVETILLHVSGEWIRGCAVCPLPKDDPQGVGSAITYLRRYSLAALLGLGQEDDDGNAASRKPETASVSDHQPDEGGDILDQKCPIRKHSDKTWRWVCDNDPDYIIGYVIPKHERTPKATKDALAAYLESSGDKSVELQDLMAEIGQLFQAALDKAEVPEDQRNGLKKEYVKIYNVADYCNPTLAECQKVLEGMKDKSPDGKYDNFLDYWIAKNSLPF